MLFKLFILNKIFGIILLEGEKYESRKNKKDIVYRYKPDINSLVNKEEMEKRGTGRRGKEREGNGDTHAVEKGVFEGVDNYD